MKNDLIHLVNRWMNGDTTRTEEQQLYDLLRIQPVLTPEQEAILTFLATALKGRNKEVRQQNAEQILCEAKAPQNKMKRPFNLRKIAAIFISMLILSGVIYTSVRDKKVL